MKVVLVEWRAAKTLPQWGALGIQYIASSLRKAGFEVHVILFEGVSIKKASETILLNVPDIVGITLFAETNAQIYELTKHLKAGDRKIRIFVGGHTASLYAAKILAENKYIDIVCRGEGELTVLDLCDTIKRGGNLSGCRGIFYRDNGVFHRNQDRELVNNLDLLDHPVFDILDKSGDSKDPNRFVSVSTSRGCLGRCVFCVEHRVSRTGENSPAWRGRTPEHILDEIILLKNKFPDKRLVVRFVDGAIEDPDPAEKKRLRKLMNLMEENHIELSFSFLTRAESWSGNDLDLIRQMRRLGLFSVSIGFESGSADTLRILGKRATIADNHLVCSLFEEAGISVYAFVMMFQPYSTFEDLKETAKFLKERKFAVRPEHWGHAMYIYPDTPIFLRAAKDGLITGLDETGFMYRYAFCEGEVGWTYELMQRIEQMEGTRKFQLNIDKIRQEQELVTVWADRNEDIRRIGEVLKELNRTVHKTAQLAGEMQYQLFMEILKEVKNGRRKDREDWLAHEWGTALMRYSKELDTAYLNYKMKAGRLQIRTI